MHNPQHFHALDGSGYAFLREMITVIDPINPQVAAHLASPFTLWKRYDEPRQILMKKELKELAKLKLSSGLEELVTKSRLGLGPTK
jgi:aminopeptidase N